MSELYERFTGFPEFLDIRQDQLADVYRAIHTLKNIQADDPNEVIRIISTLDLQRIHRMYQNKCYELQRGNNNLRYSIQRASFRPFKAVLGDIDYV